jgi:hypothetical protein
VLLPWNRALHVHMGGEAIEKALPGLLNDIAGDVKSRKDLHLVLADSHFHFDLVQGDYRSTSDRHLQAIASACVAEVLGDSSADRLVRWQLQPDMRHMLICAMLSQDVVLLDDGATRQRLNLRSLQSEFCTQWNAHSSLLPDSVGVFAVASFGYAVVVVEQGGSITALSAGTTPDGKALEERVEQLLSSIGLDAEALKTFLLVQDRTATLAVTQRWLAIDAARGTL